MVKIDSFRLLYSNQLMFDHCNHKVDHVDQTVIKHCMQYKVIGVKAQIATTLTISQFIYQKHSHNGPWALTNSLVRSWELIFLKLKQIENSQCTEFHSESGDKH